MRIGPDALIVGLEVQANDIDGGDGYVAYIRDGAIVKLTGRGHCKPTPWQAQRATELAMRLNKDLAFDDAKDHGRQKHRRGGWVVAWCNPDPSGLPHKLLMLFKDEDGDVKFTVEDDRPAYEIIASATSVLDHMEMCAQSHKAYLDWMRDADVRDGQLIKRAQGQRSARKTHLLI